MPAASAGRGGTFAVLSSRYFFWLVLALPAAVQTARYWQGSVFYGEYLHWTGQFAAQLLIVTMAVTPLRLAFPAARWLQWLARRRRYVGVATWMGSQFSTVEDALMPVLEVLKQRGL